MPALLVKIYYLGSTPSVCSRSHGRFSPSAAAWRACTPCLGPFFPLFRFFVRYTSVVHIIISQYNSSYLCAKNIISRHI